jgi:O-antigen ligase
MIAVALLVGAAVGADPTYAVIAVLLGFLVTAMLVKPDLTTPAVIFLIFANVPGVAVQSHGAPSVFAALVFMLLAVPLVAGLLQGERFVITPVLGLLLVLLIAELASTIQSANQAEALNKLQGVLFEALLLYLLSSNVIRTPATLRSVLWMILGAGTFLSLVTVFQAVTHSYWHFYFGFALPDPSFAIGKAVSPRASGPVGDPNYYGQILIVAACVGLVYGFRAPKAAQRLVAFGSVVVISYAILLTYSRGTMLALFLIVVIMAFLRYFKGWQIALLVFLLVGVVAVVPAFRDRIASVSSVSSATQQTGSDPNADQSTQGRATEMLAATHVFLDHPLLGVGPANFPLYYRQYAEQIGGEIHDTVAGGKDRGAQAQRQAHNMYISQLAELGLVGALAFFAIIVAVVRSLIRTRRACLADGRSDDADLATALLLAVIGYLVCGFFLTLAFERYFWLLLGIAGASTAIALRPTSSSSSGPP